MLAIEVAFLTGRYVATAYNTRAEAEWPPHPARLFSALVAAHCDVDATNHSGRAGERGALEWLERQGPPLICSSAAARRDVVTVFVPVNDVALTNVDDEAGEVERARGDLRQADAGGHAPAVKKAQTALAKAESTLQKATKRATGVPTSAVHPDHGRKVLPEYRNRQPRTFPSVTPEEPRVVFVWPEAAPTMEQRAGLLALLRRVVRLGHSSSLVGMRLIDNPPLPTWRPADDGEESLRVVEAGQLRALEEAFQRHRGEEPRVMPALAQSYTSRAEHDTGATAESVFSQTWLVLRRVEGPHLPMSSAVGLARAVRKALLAYASEPIPEALSGHSPDGRPSALPHLAVVPLPFVGHAHATGTVLGFGLVLPRSVSEFDKRAVYGAVSKWEERYRQEDEDTPAIQLNLGAAGELHLERVEWGTVQVSLRSSVWCEPAALWSSVTPVALDRNPGDLRSRDPRRLAEAVAEAEADVRRACERIGLPEPYRVDILPAAPWAGAAKSRAYPPYPGVEGRAQRVLTHARIAFERPVRGPVLLGAGRFVGLGLFRPEER